MKTIRIICLFGFIVFFSKISAQNEFSKWYFGKNAGLDFSTSPPTVLTNGIINTFEGVATIADNQGNLLFYTDGITVMNKNHVVMANGNGLSGHLSSTQGAMIVKQPGNNPNYYIFTTTAGGLSVPAAYSIVDMSLAASLGSVTVKNATLYANTCEKQVAVRHCNGRDVWAVSHHFGSNEFRAYSLTSTGVNSTPVISAIGSSVSGSYNSVFGHLKISPDGKKLISAVAGPSSSFGSGASAFELFDFDPATGIVSNSLSLLSAPAIPSGYIAYGVEFSPDGSKLYGTTSSVTSPTGSAVFYQWDLCAGSNSAIIASCYSITAGFIQLGSVQRAIDGKIYLASFGQPSLSVIHNPNLSGAAMNFTLNSLSVSTGTPYSGLPNFINSFSRPQPAPFTMTLACHTVSFTSPPNPTHNNGCSVVSDPYTGYLWNFGEPNSGAANSSTLAHPTHAYSTAGNFSVTLILYSACTSDTLRQIINITNINPCTAINELEIETLIHVFPNPVNNELNIYKESNLGSLTISLFSANGQLILRKITREKNILIKLEDINQGLIIVNILTESGRNINYKILKE